MGKKRAKTRKRHLRKGEAPFRVKAAEFFVDHWPSILCSIVILGVLGMLFFDKVSENHKIEAITATGALMAGAGKLEFEQRTKQQTAELKHDVTEKIDQTHSVLQDKVSEWLNYKSKAAGGAEHQATAYTPDAEGEANKRARQEWSSSKNT